MKKLLILLTAASLLCSCARNADREHAKRLQGKRVLVFCGYGEGFVHDNIRASAEMLMQLGQKYGFAADTASSTAVFDEQTLHKYDIVAFANASYVDFDSCQRKAFQDFIRRGGGFVGLHAATCTGNKWRWFTEMIGGCFAGHPRLQKFTVKTTPEGKKGIGTLPDSIQAEDELYLFRLMNPTLKVLAVSETGQLDWGADKAPEGLPEEIPAVWYNNFEGGRIWYTALGHNKEDYARQWYREHVVKGLCRVAGKR